MFIENRYRTLEYQANNHEGAVTLQGTASISWELKKTMHTSSVTRAIHLMRGQGTESAQLCYL